MSFSDKAQAEKETFTFDFVRLLGTGETISTSTWTVTVKAGTDPTPSSMLSGAPAVAGTKVSHLIQGGVLDTRYCIKCQITTSAGQTLELADDVWVRATAC